MITLFKWLARGLVAIFLLAACALGLVYYLASHSLPDYDASYTLQRLDRPIEIVRDNHAVPHIFAETDTDALFGLGFVHAQDRLWQMTLMRRTVQGRLSEIFGADTLEIDHLMRALDLYGLSVTAVRDQSQQTQDELQSYADGVNAYLDLIQTEALGRGAPEFFLFEPAIAPWTPADSIAIQKLMAFQLSDMAEREVLQAELSLRLSPERLADLGNSTVPAVIDLPEFAALFPAGTEFAAVATRPPRHPLNPQMRIGETGASNAFAADASRAAANAPLLANDPHLALYAPSFWMIARLEFSSGPAIGGTIPGLPSILIGRNEDLAWGLTTSYLDDQDLFIERINPDNPAEYITQEGPRRFRTDDTVIDVKDAEPITHKLRWTQHGPVIPAPHFNAEAITPEGHVTALAWTALQPGDRTIEGALTLMRSHSVESALDAASLITSPSQNLMLADRRKVASVATGIAPIRHPNSISQGLLPSAGWLAVNDWQGFYPFAENPGITAPEGGIVLNTNNRLTDQPFPRHWSHTWGDTERVRRAEWLLNGREFHTLDSFTEIQTDTISPAARSLLPLIARDLWYQGEPAASETRERMRQQALEALAAWNGEMNQHGFEPLVYAAWVRELQRRLLIDDIGPLTAEMRTPIPIFLERVFRDENGASEWCDIRQSVEKEDCVTIARLALDAALIELSEKYGDRLDSWRWGAAHAALHRHQALGRVPGLAWLVNIRQETPGGDFTLLRGKSTGKGEEPYLNTHAAGLRMVVDFADPEASQIIISTGQSGHILSRHYDDLSLLWRRAEYIPMSVEPELVRGGAVGITHLEPAAQ
ncbi:penicillin acylase family protein [Algicella marina]|uniref:Penicillin acylase family protein n=1 Tax=Algicella marina TaxID=2683284 RepID=A0A6P1T059_9RHOB|nr:penicillin acylase family protein [Algicella marina]QHQ34669.1 penicillin acylase family protein [Algicella marina]